MRHLALRAAAGALLAVACVAPAATARAQQRQLTAADYDRAVKMLGFDVDSLVVGGRVDATWLPGDRFFFRDRTPSGTGWVLVDPARRTRRPLCDASGRCAADTTQAARRGRSGRGASANEILSPDGTRAAFIRDWNLWVRDVATGKETQLTTDGVENYGYATDNAGWIHSDRPVLLWSPDGKKIATQQQDDRHVGDMYLVETRVGHPRLLSWKYPLPGDSIVSMIRRVIIDVDSAKVIPLRTPPDYHRAMLGDNLSMRDLIWSPDGSQLAYVSTSRDHKRATVKLADARTGEVRTLFEETSPTQFESVAGWKVLWKRGIIVWSSERNDWSELYAYDLHTGKLLHPITTGPGPIEGIPFVDEQRGTLIVEAQGREPGEDPYFRHYYGMRLDGTHWTPLTPEVGDHTVQVAPDGKYFVDSWSTPTTPPTVVLRDARGRVVMPLAKADISKLLAWGWKPPIPFTVTARDGKTTLYGLMFRPTDFDSTKRYPIINNPYPGPQSGSVGSRSFQAARGDRQALAELGFVVITVDGMGTPGRSKSFHDAYYGAMGRDNTLPDQVGAMKQLAARYPWIDIDRAGIYGHSGGGFATADAMFRYPDFFKVGIAESGNHDQREYEDDWGERYQGLLVRQPDGSDNYAPEANESVAKNLEGHLLLVHGSIDDNVPPYNTMLVAQALIRANRDFDELIIPNVHHGYGDASNYMMRRRWDYFVRYLLGAEPPKEYEIPTPGRRPVSE